MPIFGVGDGNFPNGNLPPFAGGGIPSFVGGGTWPIDGFESNNNQTTGNGNWYFNSDNQTTGNGNWYFGNGNQTIGNGNWYLGNDNTIAGNGNRSSGSGNTITGNGNRPDGNDNNLTGNRISISEDNQTIFGNGDRYFVIDSNGNVTLVNDATASDNDRTYELNFPDDSGVLNSNPFLTAMNTNSNTDDNTGGDNSELLELLRQSPFGRLFDIPGFEIDSPEDIFGNVGGGGNPFPGGGGGIGGNPWRDWNPLTDGNPFIDGDEPEISSSSTSLGGGGNPFGGEEFDTTDGDYPTQEDYVFDFDFSGDYPTQEDYQYDFDDLTNGNSVNTSNVANDDLLNGDYPTADDYNFTFDFSGYPTADDYTYDFSNIGDFFNGENPFGGGGSLPFPVGTDVSGGL
ncbi:hypothetical protein C7H19_05845 [Aphanothece hegewaldii CCALA 016]|uniref:Uncharacterized protein n=2 Tax=Aphanothece TaxID=1121 RepID=A0A2T1M1H4_9CHRO|nr:hypothetical protein C7H19_05845 [Aphanothece hegewaldii CCALA 016]